MSDQVNVADLLVPKFNQLYDHSAFPALAQDGCIPPKLLQTILQVYENETLETLKKCPNNLLCTSDGKFWTTWTFILFLKKHIKKNQKPLLYLPNGTPLFAKE